MSIKMKKIVVLILVLYVLSFCVHVYALPSLTTDNLVVDDEYTQIEQSAYIKDYTKLNLYTFSGYDKGILQSVPAETANSVQKIVEFVVPTLNPYDAEYSLPGIIVTLDKEKLFKVFDWYEAIYEYYQENQEKRFFKDYVNGIVSIHEVLESVHKKEQPFENIATFLKVNGSDDFLCADIRTNGSDGLYIWSYDSESATSDLGKILRMPEVRKQLRESTLDLSNTKVKVIKKFSILNFFYWWYLFYDDNGSEYYLCPFTTEYLQEHMLSDFIHEDEKAAIKLEAYRLYDIKKDLVPFILEEYNLSSKLVVRAQAARDYQKSQSK